MITARKRPSGCALRALTASLVLTLLAVLLLAGTASAAAKPGKPTAKAPKGTIATTMPAFKWSKAPRAAKYEVRVYKGSKLQLKKTSLTKRSWKASKALPKNVSLTWKVRARNARGDGAWSRSLRFKIVPPSSAKAITAFTTPTSTGTVIDQSAHTIAVSVPHGTSVSALVASFTTTGASVKVGAVTQTSGSTANDFTSPVTYTVTAADASTQAYVVTVTVAADPAKAITAFTTPTSTGTVIDQSAHTIAVSVPHGTSVSALVASFTTTGASVKVGAVTQTSGSTANDFTSPVTYTVTAADASTQAYVVTVTVAAVAIGDAYGGGIVAYILQSGDPGYVAGETHGLIAATADQSTGIVWAITAYQSTDVPGAKYNAIGTGAANTDAIIAQNGAGIGYAAGLARACTDGGYSDWYLPSKDELNQLYLNRGTIGGFHAVPSDRPYYWSSSQAADHGSLSWFQGLDGGYQPNDSKANTFRVRAVRAF